MMPRTLTYSRARREGVRRHYSLLGLSPEGLPMCSWPGCGSTHALELDHIHNDGAKRRKVNRNAYNWARQHRFPPVLQTLCRFHNLMKEASRGEVAALVDALKEE